MFFINAYATSMILGITFTYMMTLENEAGSQMTMLACAIGLSTGGVAAVIPKTNFSVIIRPLC